MYRVYFSSLYVVKLKKQEETKFVGIREQKEIVDRIDEIARKEGLDRSGYLRRLIRRSLGLLEAEKG